MKETLIFERLPTLKSILKSKLNGRNAIMAINAWTVLVLLYCAELVNYNNAERVNTDPETRKRSTVTGMVLLRVAINYALSVSQTAYVGKR